jgi:hypothetical protein
MIERIVIERKLQSLDRYASLATTASAGSM